MRRAGLPAVVFGLVNALFVVVAVTVLRVTEDRGYFVYGPVRDEVSGRSPWVFVALAVGLVAVNAVALAWLVRRRSGGVV